MKKLSFYILLVLISLNLTAQNNYTQTIRGTVIDKNSQLTLPGATVVLLNSDPVVGTSTDMDGNFVLNNISIGRQGIVVSYLGYNTISLNGLNLTSGKELVLRIELEEKVNDLSEVVITSKQRKDMALNKMATVSARSFTVEETERYAGSLGDPSRMVSNYAGVAMTNDSRNDIIIRGNSPSGLLWRLDGVEIPNPNHFSSFGTTGGPVSMLNNNLLTNSDFMTSAFPSEYGNVISGVFDLKMRTGNKEKREYTGQIGFNGFELGAEGPFKKGSKATYLANFRYSTMEVFHAMGLEFGTGTAIPQYKDLTFKVNVPTKKYGNFNLIGLGGISFIELNDSESSLLNKEDDLNYNYGGVDLDYGSDMAVLGLSHQYFLNERSRLETNISVLGNRATTHIDSLKFDENGSIIQNSNYLFYNSIGTEIKYSFSTHLKTKLNSKNNTSFGIYYDTYHVDYLDSFRLYKINGFAKYFDITGNISMLRGYGQWQHIFNSKLKLNSGIYSAYNSINDEFVLEPRVNMRYNITPSQSLSFGYGLHSIMQPRMYYFIQSLVDTVNLVYAQNNLNLKMTKSHQLVLGYDNVLSENFRFKSEVYCQYLYDVPVSKATPQFFLLNSGDSFTLLVGDSLVNKGTGYNYGLELTLEKFFDGNYYFLTTLSLFDSKYKGYDGIERNTSFNGNFVWNVLGGYEFKLGKHNSLSLSLRSVYAGGKRYIPIDVEQSITDNFTRYNWKEAYVNKFDDYFRLDARISFKINGKRINQEWAIDLQNFTNNKNIYSESFNPRSKSTSYDYQTGFYPMFLYRIQF